MEIFYLFLVIIGTSVLWGPALVIYFIYKYLKRRPDSQPARVESASDSTIASLNEARDKLWTDYLGTFQAVTTTIKERALLQALMTGVSSDEFSGKTKSAPIDLTVAEANAAVASVTLLPDVNEADSPNFEAAPPREPIDNTLLLLYFGAFLLVASVGLFVALGGLPGIIRTFIVAATAAVLYFGGLQLYVGSKKLAVAGISFVGSGMIIAPLTGVAWYNLVADKTGGPLIWLVTSLACITLYVYAYKRIKNDFTAYLLIGSFVSTIESSVLTIGLPTYGYAWGLVVVGIILLMTSRSKQVAPILDRSSATSASLLVPLSLLGSVFLLPEFGNIQLAITLLLAGVYYGLLSVWEETDRRQFRMAAQAMVLAAATNVVYAVEPSYVAVGVALTVGAAAYALVVASVKAGTDKTNGLTELACVVSALAIAFSITSPWAVIAALVVAAFLAVVVWLHQQSDEGLQIAGAILLALPFVIGLYALDLDLGSMNQMYLAAASAFVVFMIVAVTAKKKDYKPYYNTAAIIFWAGAAAVLIPALLIGSGQVVAVILALLVACLVLRKLSGDVDWLLGSSVIVLIPFLYGAIDKGFDSQMFSLSVFGALAWNIAMSLKTREAVTRWLVVGLILLAPVAIGSGGLGFKWESFGFSIGYILAMLSCVLARTIARGKLLVSFKVPIASYYTAASQAYVVGYILAGIIALVLSLDTADSQILTTALLAVIAVVTLLISKIERNAEIMAILPVLLQLAIFSGLRPDLSDGAEIGLTAIILTVAAAVTYWLPMILSEGTSKAAIAIRQISLVAAYVGPGLAFTQSDPSRLLPVALFIAGLLTLHYFNQTSQQNREVSLAVCFASIHWLIYLFGVTNIHVHTHILAVFLAAFAFWRYSRGERAAYDSYIQAIFLIVTVPLILTSLSNEAGGIYGLILIGEQILFMLAGVTLPTDKSGHRFLLRWGLWTALAAILFQLRGLGWAFTSLLAVIVIGVAIYRLQKSDK